MKIDSAKAAIITVLVIAVGVAAGSWLAKKAQEGKLGLGGNGSSEAAA